MSSDDAEVDLVDLVDDVAQQVAGEHPVVGLPEHRGQHVARVVLLRAGQPAQVGQQLAVDERRAAPRRCARSDRPPSRASGRAPRSPAGSSASVTSRLSSSPSNALRNRSQASCGIRSRSPLRPGVLAHRVAGALDDRRELRLRRHRRCLLLGSCHVTQLSSGMNICAHSSAASAAAAAKVGGSRSCSAASRS